jgi:hypothetical protein
MSKIHFSNWLAFLGVIGGVTMALGLPWIVLVYGPHLAEGVQLTVIILGLLGGGTLAVVSAFFGIVIPTAVTDGKLDLRGCCDDAGVPGSGRSTDAESGTAQGTPRSSGCC